MVYTLESLNSVTWSSFFAGKGEVHDVDLGGEVNRKTTIWILREYI
jgi:hypothetical protein